MSWNITGAPGTGEDLLYSQAGTPTLDLRFASSKNLNDYVSGQNLITYTRAGDATFFDANGTIQTAGADVARFDHNPATGESLGLLIEEARTNLLLNSETLSTQDVTVTAAAHTLSFYGTGTVTLSGTHSATVVGTGAFPTRTTLTFTPTSGSLTVTVSGTVQYGQVELGAFATSWISTAGATATRNADVASITGTNFSRWYSQSAGTFRVRFSTLWNGFTGNTLVINPGLFVVNNLEGTGFRGMGSRLVTNADSSVRFGSRLASTLVDSSLNYSAGIVAGQNMTMTGAYTSDGLLGTVNGNTVSAVSLDANYGLMTINQLQIGQQSIGGAPTQLNGHIRRLAYFDRRLPNATLQAITA
jgi:hypothetical protein